MTNHIPLDSASGAGNHTMVQLLEQTNAQQTNAGEISVYTKDASDQTDQIFLRYQGNGQEFQFTNYQIYSIVPTALQTSYFTFLPGRVLLYFGTFIWTFGIPYQIINLIPPVALNIISVVSCSTGTTTGLSKPYVIIPKPTNQYYKTIQLKMGPLQATPPRIFYAIMANV